MRRGSEAGEQDRVPNVVNCTRYLNGKDVTMQRKEKFHGPSLGCCEMG